ncbi:MAG: hypothetical protein BV457_00030 [Thermoplasmata archaeon M9B1D]|nr:MAG: hypothetical protein BV457_00030 [Thermoplasmata archaeon M9B1D]PNX52248.1 MAG: hypothetical protein BV456_00265 [Thermoplasmata archaeon M8B2D]
MGFFKSLFCNHDYKLVKSSIGTWTKKGEPFDYCFFNSLICKKCKKTKIKCWGFEAKKHWIYPRLKQKLNTYKCKNHKEKK